MTPPLDIIMDAQIDLAEAWARLTEAEGGGRCEWIAGRQIALDLIKNVRRRCKAAEELIETELRTPNRVNAEPQTKPTKG